MQACLLNLDLLCVQATTDHTQQEKHTAANHLLRAAIGTDKASVDPKSQKRFSKLSSVAGLLPVLKDCARSAEAPNDQQRAADRLQQLIKQADSGLQQQIAVTLAEVTGWQNTGMTAILTSCA